MSPEQRQKSNKAEQEYLNWRDSEDDLELLRRVDEAGIDNNGFQRGYKLKDGDIRMFTAAQRLCSNPHQFGSGKGLLLVEKMPFHLVRKEYAEGSTTR